MRRLRISGLGGSGSGNPVDDPPSGWVSRNLFVSERMRCKTIQSPVERHQTITERRDDAYMAVMKLSDAAHWAVPDRVAAGLSTF
jgi:hypothetical protein